MERIDKLRVTDSLSAIDNRMTLMNRYAEMSRNNRNLLEGEYAHFAKFASKHREILRPMMPTDVIKGDIYILIVEGYDEFYVGTIDEIINPRDKWKAFCSDDGCRYGLDGCYVVKEEFRTCDSQ